VHVDAGVLLTREQRDRAGADGPGFVRVVHHHRVLSYF